MYGEDEAGLQLWMQRFGALAREVGASQSLADVCKASMAVAQECMAAQTAAASAKASCNSQSWPLHYYDYLK